MELEPAASAPNEVRGGEAQLMVPEEAGHSLGEELQRQRRKMQEQQASPGLIEVQRGVGVDRKAPHSRSRALCADATPQSRIVCQRMPGVRASHA